MHGDDEAGRICSNHTAQRESEEATQSCTGGEEGGDLDEEPAVQLCREPRCCEMYGIGVELVCEASKVSVVLARNVRNHKDECINDRVKRGDVLIGVESRDVRALNSTFVVENLVLGAHGSCVALTFESQATKSCYEIVALRHVRVSSVETHNVLFAVAPQLQGRQLTAHRSIVNILNAIRRCLVDAEGRSLDVLPPLVPPSSLYSHIAGDEEMVYWSMGLMFRSKSRALPVDNGKDQAEKEWYQNLVELPINSLSSLGQSLITSEAAPLVVERVFPAGPASSCDIQEGDIVEEVDGQPANSENALFLLREPPQLDDKEGGRDGCCSGGHGIGRASILSLKRGAQSLQVKIVRTAPAFVRYFSCFPQLQLC